MEFKYEEKSLKPGIYKLTNVKNGRVYFGSTARFKRRWKQHDSTLEKNKHSNKFLQADYNKCGTEAFVFEVVEVMEDSIKAERLVREEYWIHENIKIGVKLYNSNLTPTKENKVWSHNPEKTREKQSRAMTGRRHTEASKQKNRDKKKLYLASDEGKAFVAREKERRSGKSYEEQYGVERAAEIKKKIRDDKLIVMNRPEVKENLRKQLTGKSFIERFGAEHASEILRKKSLARKGKYTGTDSPHMKTVENIQLLSPAGELFTKVEGIKIFALEHELIPNKLSELLAGKRKTHKGWRLINNIIPKKTI